MPALLACIKRWKLNQLRVISPSSCAMSKKYGSFRAGRAIVTVGCPTGRRILRGRGFEPGRRGRVVHRRGPDCCARRSGRPDKRNRLHSLAWLSLLRGRLASKTSNLAFYMGG